VYCKQIQRLGKGRAGLDVGEKESAIENFKKSVQLNPKKHIGGRWLVQYLEVFKAISKYALAKSALVNMQQF